MLVGLMTGGTRGASVAPACGGVAATLSGAATLCWGISIALGYRARSRAKWCCKIKMMPGILACLGLAVSLIGLELAKATEFELTECVCGNALQLITKGEHEDREAQVRRCPSLKAWAF